MSEIHPIPLDAIEDTPFVRDRGALDPDALFELRASILDHGLRMPIEVFEAEEPEGEKRYGLISGYRRLAAFRELHEATRDKTRFATIPAFIREPQGLAEALTAMVEENAIRVDVSPWEQATVAVTARDRALFETVDAAIDTLYRNLHRQKRTRLRSIAQLIEEMDGLLTAPESLNQRQLLRLAAAAARGYGPLMRHALEQSSRKAAEHQWQLLLPIVAESEDPDAIPPRNAFSGGKDRPRRLLSPRQGLKIRRERTCDGWCLHFTGREASSALMDDIFDEIERIFIPM